MEYIFRVPVSSTRDWDKLLEMFTRLKLDRWLQSTFLDRDVGIFAVARSMGKQVVFDRFGDVR